MIVAAAILVLLIVVVGNIIRCSSPAQSQDQTSASSQSTSTSASDGSTQASTGSGSSTSSNASSSTSSSSSSSTTSSAASSSASSSGADAPAKLEELIGKEETAKLLETARTDTQALWIAAHPDEFALDGEEVQVKILKLAAEEPKSVPYVRSFPSEYPLKKFVDDSSIAMPSESPSADIPSTKVPHFYQWDRRWGNITYSSAAFGLTGCGPTSMAMVYQGLTGKTDINPAQMAEMAEERGYMSEYNGTANTFFGEIAGELGITYEEESPSAAALTEALSAGKVVIARLGPGLFTERGHFFVLAGLADNGEVILNDPYSYERSSRTWPAETIAEEATIFYVYSAG